MSTRTNIVIQTGQTNVYLYRHHDGYLTETGADLLKKLNAANDNPSLFLESLLAERYDKQNYETVAKRVYELTTEVHGDIGYLYVVRFDDSNVTTGYAARGSYDNNVPEVADVKLGSKATFAEAVNKDIRATNRRLADLRKKQPGAYGDATDYAEVTA